MAVAYLASTLLLRFRNVRLGVVGIALVSHVTTYFMGAAALTNARVGSDIAWVAVTAGPAAIAFAGLVAAANVLFRPGDASGSGNVGPWITIALYPSNMAPSPSR